MTVQTIPFALQNSSHGAELFRRAVNSLLPWGSYTRFGTAGRGGVVESGDFAASQHSAGNMSVDVAAGEAWVAGAPGLGANIGAYYGLNDGIVNLAISTSDPTNPRIDTVVLQVEDAQYSGANNDIKLAVVAGTPTSGANLTNLNGKGAVPNNGLVLSYVLVPAGASSILTADISNVAVIVGARPICRVWRNAAYTTSTSSSVMPFDEVLEDNRSGFSLGTGLYTAPVAGLYSVKGQLIVNATAAGQYLQTQILANGVNVKNGDNSAVAAGYFATPVLGDVRVSAGQTIGLYQFTSVALAGLVGQAYSYMDIVKVSD